MGLEISFTGAEGVCATSSQRIWGCPLNITCSVSSKQLASTSKQILDGRWRKVAVDGEEEVTVAQ